MSTRPSRTLERSPLGGLPFKSKAVISCYCPADHVWADGRCRTHASTWGSGALPLSYFRECR